MEVAYGIRSWTARSNAPLVVTRVGSTPITVVDDLELAQFANVMADNRRRLRGLISPDY
jgi:hypothetical protein